MKRSIPKDVRYNEGDEW